jgi:hypothetical protein
MMANRRRGQLELAAKLGGGRLPAAGKYLDDLLPLGVHLSKFLILTPNLSIRHLK